MKISYDFISKQGDRQVNEDCLAIYQYENTTCFCLCDGLGGHGFGDRASRFVCSHIENELNQFLVSDFQIETANIDQLLQSLVLNAHHDLQKEQQFTSHRGSMMTTVCVLLVSNGKANYIHIGDSRIYHFRDYKLIMRTKDHSVPQKLVEMGQLKEKKIRHHEDRNRLLRVVGTTWNDDIFIPPSGEIELLEGDAFLLCSDGFWEWVNEKEMIKTLKKAVSPDTWLKKMQATAVRNGKSKNMDNYSAIAIWAGRS